MSKALGRGLEALIPGWNNDTKINQENIQMIPIEALYPSINQPRIFFNEEKLQELADSIKEKGVLQPIIVCKTDKGYQIIAGERRYRASKIAGLKEMPVVIKNFSDHEKFEIAFLENIQREDLNPIEEAEAYQFLMRAYNLSQEEIAKKVNKNRSTVANILRLLSLPKEIRDEIIKGNISGSQARSLLSMPDDEIRKNILKEILEQGKSVRELEKIARKEKVKKQPIQTQDRDAEIEELENNLVRKFMTKIKIETKGKGQELNGNIKISFSSLEELERIISMFK